jgi:hypothetical protein
MKRAQYRIPASKKNTAILKQLNQTGELVFDEYYVAKGDYVLVLTSAEIELLKQYEIKPERVEKKDIELPGKKKLLIERATDDDSDDFLSTGFVDAYLDAAEVAARIESLAAEFPSLCQLTILPYATSGYDGSNAALTGPANVQLLRITNNAADVSRPGLLLVCGTHAREWINPLIAIEFAEQLLRNYNPASADSDVAIINRIIEEGDIFIVPVMNPDGLNFSRHDDNGWRKNRRVNAAPACPGVDNNRNYELFFGEGGSSASECSEAYHGPDAFSEPENRNIKYIVDHYPNILIGVDSHSQGEEIFRPTINGGVAIASLPVFPGDETIYESLESAAVAAIQAVSGTTYGTGSTSNHAGTSDEYMFFGHRIFAFDFECALSFQPPIASGLVSVQEVTAALRALAVKAIDLELAATTPVNIVQCIDRTGSMISFGYEDSAKLNASRFVDLMSIGDRAAVVSFADPSSDPLATPPEDRAVIEYPLTLINDAGDYGPIISSIDSIIFGGWTSIGAGLSKAAGLLTAAATPKAIILLSDGYENRDPSAASVLAGFPADIKVYTIALGSLADIPLMQEIATQTGGAFYQSPDALELHEIYNLVRSSASDDDLLLNKKIDSSDDDYAKPHKVFVEAGADKLIVSLSWENNNSKPDILIVDPVGRRVQAKDWGVSRQYRDGYLIIQVDRPMPGHWTIQTLRTRSAHVIAAFIRSPLKIRLHTKLEKSRKRNIYNVLMNMKLPGNIKLSQMTGTAMLKNVLPFDRQKYVKLKKNDWIDQFPERFKLCDNAPASDPQLFENRFLAHLQQHDFVPSKKKGKDKGIEKQYRFSFDSINKPGIYQVELYIEGWLNDKFRFERVARVDLVV